MLFRISCACLLPAIASIIISCSKSPEADPLTASIDSVMQSVADTAEFNGNVLVSKNGKVIYQESFGKANFYTGDDLNDSSVFELASVSKAFTAMGIMMLKEKGLLGYDDDVTKYIPELPYKGMTVRHFLQHTSGIAEYGDVFEKTGWDWKVIAFNKDIVEAFQKHQPPVLFAPGEKWEYSNTGYTLLAVIIERVSGKSYSAFLEENIFSPLHMTHTRTYNTRRSTKEVIPNYAYGFVYSDSLKKYVLPDSLKDYFYVYTLDGIEGDGIVNSTTSDLFKWDQALYTDKLVSNTTLEEAFTSGRLSNDSLHQYGFGWFIENDAANGKIVLHTGGWPGYGNLFKRFVDGNNAIIILSNVGGPARRTIEKEITRRLAR
jgi:CubicO group peptidase (beta-lactamase class C family)